MRNGLILSILLSFSLSLLAATPAPLFWGETAIKDPAGTLEVIAWENRMPGIQRRNTFHVTGTVTWDKAHRLTNSFLRITIRPEKGNESPVVIRYAVTWDSDEHASFRSTFNDINWVRQQYPPKTRLTGTARLYINTPEGAFFIESKPFSMENFAY